MTLHFSFSDRNLLAPSRQHGIFSQANTKSTVRQINEGERGYVFYFQRIRYQNSAAELA